MCILSRITGEKSDRIGHLRKTPGLGATRDFRVGSGSLGRGLAHALVDVVGKLREVLDKLADQVAGSLIVLLLIRPGPARVEQLAVHARNADRNLEAEVGILAEFGIVEAAVELLRKLKD